MVDLVLKLYQVFFLLIQTKNCQLIPIHYDLFFCLPYQIVQAIYSSLALMESLHQVTSDHLHFVERVGKSARLHQPVHKRGGLITASGIQQIAFYCVFVFHIRLLISGFHLLLSDFIMTACENFR